MNLCIGWQYQLCKSPLSHGCAKYISVHMTTNPYALGKLTLDGPTKWGEIHAAPRYDYLRVQDYSDDNLRELLPSWHESLNVDTALVEMRNRSLQAKIHQYQCQMACLKQLNDQMEAIQAEMFTILPKKHQCIERLSRAQALPCVRKQIGQHIREVTPYEAKCGHPA